MDFLMRKLTGIEGPVKNGVPSEAIITGIADTGTTVSSPSTGPESPVYQLTLLVTPLGGAGAPYTVTVKSAIPRIYAPMILPGATIGVLIDPLNPNKVSPDYTRVAQPAMAGVTPAGTMRIDFDKNGVPEAGDMTALVGAVRSGQMPTQQGSADALLASGTRGTAMITSAQPLGKFVRDVNPHADPSRLNDPVWVFTAMVSVQGVPQFPATFGHRVPLAKVAEVAPGIRVVVAVDMSDPTNEVAIDWDQSPLA